MEWQARLEIYAGFSHYYQGQYQQAGLLSTKVRDYLTYGGAAGACLAESLRPVDDDDLDSLEFEYNRLFVGPGKLLAPPYEGAYRNAERLLMQEETMAVRTFYRRCGVAVKRESAIPDDHLGFELEFVSYLLFHMIRSDKNPDVRKRLQGLYGEFFRQHLCQWVYLHCQDVLAHAKNRLCRDMAILLSGFLHREELNLR